MSEGPQVKLRTDWLSRHLTGCRVDRVFTARPDLTSVAEELCGDRVARCDCKGKHIFIQFTGGVTLHNHLLMRGKWRALKGPFLFLPDGIWLGLEMGAKAICNINGQVLEAVTEDEVQEIRNRLGPDVMSDPYPHDEIMDALRGCALPVSEALLDQSLLSGIGNVAKSESLYRAQVDPRQPAASLSEAARVRLVVAMREIMMESYHTGGRWIHRVYHRRGAPCPTCGGRIASIRMPPSRRATYFCPRCQFARRK